ncbi:hypothetical protein [Bradyrhizobium sp. LVM 105]|uniref:hypothetical protein n=1 Tax=Bradyrhizobium sp. LVM 105 TaxID=2341115 RepID=UPI0013DEFD0F|nr:hypothetical protein [Bradyrhizobium sp. LVM 105]
MMAPVNPSEPPFDEHDPIEVGEALICLGLDILEQELERRREAGIISARDKRHGQG